MNSKYGEKILEANLSTKKVVVKEVDEKILQNFIGGFGLGIKILYDEQKPGIDPLSPDNVVILTTGTLSGTSAPANGKTQVITKSPLNGLLGAGTFGGWWGPRLKHAGFITLVVKGVSDKPVYLWINDGQAELRRAEHLWGRDSWETTDALKGELGEDVSVLAIGQAGENLVRFACPIGDYDHAPGRCTAGAVWGVKKLKAIAVRGTKKPVYADSKQFLGAAKEASARIIEAGPYEGTDGWGYFDSFSYVLPNGGWGSKNWQVNYLPADNDIGHWQETAKPHLVRGPQFCYICPNEKFLGCRLVANVKTGPYAGTKVGGVFCWTHWPGLQYWVKSFPAMFKYTELCQRYGVDRNGPPIGFVMELFERGILTKEDCDGLEPKWGDEAVVMELLRKTVYREGFGDLMAEGSLRMAQKIGKGSEKYSMTHKGAEIMIFDPRSWGLMGDNLGLMVNPRGGDDQFTTRGSYSLGLPNMHKRLRERLKKMGFNTMEDYLHWWLNWLDMFDDVKKRIYGDPPRAEALDTRNIENKADAVKWMTELSSVYNSLGLCMKVCSFTFAIGPTLFAKFHSAYTGRDATPQELMKTGERIWNLTRAYLVREGDTRKYDDWPDRFYEQPVREGIAKGTPALSRAEMHGLLDKYYDLAGWDKKSGVPTKHKLTELGLDYIAEDLSKMELIADESS
jgi:aldehyde:ferredoxin oxidoreductase